MCNCKGCQKPEKLKGKPEECSPEQIRECHGDVEKHPCGAGGRERQPDVSSGTPKRGS